MAIPDIDEGIFYDCQQTRRYLEHMLARLTETIRVIRKRHNWRSSDLQALKMARKLLHPYLGKARIDRLTQTDEEELQKLFDELLSMELASVDDVR